MELREHDRVFGSNDIMWKALHGTLEHFKLKQDGDEIRKASIEFQTLKDFFNRHNLSMPIQKDFKSVYINFEKSILVFMGREDIVDV